MNLVVMLFAQPAHIERLGIVIVMAFGFWVAANTAWFACEFAGTERVLNFMVCLFFAFVPNLPRF